MKNILYLILGFGMVMPLWVVEKSAYPIATAGQCQKCTANLNGSNVDACDAAFGANIALPKANTHANATSKGSPSICQNYQTQAAAQIQVTCAPSGTPSGTPDPTATITTSTGQFFPNYDACATAVQATFGIQGQYCDAIGLYEQSRFLEDFSIGLYSVGAAACSAACACDLAGPEAWPACEAISIGCLTADMSAATTELAAVIEIAKSGAKDDSFWDKSELGMAIAGAAVGGAAAATTLDSAKDYAAKAQKQVQKIIAKSTSYFALEEASDSNFVTACAGAAATIAVATALDVDAPNLQCLECTQCQNVIQTAPKAAASNGVYNGSISQGLNTPAPGGNSTSSNPPGNGTSSSGDTMTSLNTGNLGSTPANPFAAGFSSGSAFSAASSAPGGDFLSKMVPVDQSIDALKKLGIDAAQIGNQLASGQTPASIVSGLMPDGTPTALKNTLNQIDQLGKDGKLKIPGVNSTMGSGAGAKSGKSSSGGSVISFGLSKGGITSSAPQELSYAKRNPAIAIDGTDIWHTDCHCSLFDIHSRKLTKVMDRIDQLEWATPLNRALMGLPNKPVVNPDSAKDAAKKKFNIKDYGHDFDMEKVK